MVTAVNAVRRTDVGLKKTVKSFNVLRSMLKYYAEKVNMMPTNGAGNSRQEAGTALIKLCLNVERNHFSLTTNDIVTWLGSVSLSVTSLCHQCNVYGSF
jgi:hypothetical protein